MEEHDLKAMVRRAGRGDGAAAAALFDHFHPRVFRYALGKLRNRTDAEDVAAETFARVLQELGRFSWRGAGFEAWLFRIASNLVVDHARKSGRERPQEDTSVTAELTEQRTPESVMLAGERRAELAALLDELSADQREVLLLRFAADMDTHEVGRMMGRNANAIRQLQFRAIESLRKKLDEGVIAR